METPYNLKTVTMKLHRIDLCDLMLACTMVDETVGDDNTKWSELHDKLAQILSEFDEKNFK